ncbi:MAG TPA: peptidoglycan editing factor PgeF [Candidatus Omnitrophota bacterium]|nr:peptidoglycan editing factor PgeF [Candidatus Omnitrophota bacterium]
MAITLFEDKGCHSFEIFAGASVSAAFSDRKFNMRFSEDFSVPRNDREIFFQILGASADRLVCMDQIHGGNIVLVTESLRGKGAHCRADAVPNADALITREKGIPLGVLTADCASVFFHDPRKQAAGVAHVGWRGLFNKLPQKMVAAFSGNFLSRSEDLCVALGPMIRRCCYEVGADVASHFPGAVEDRDGKIYLDLTAGILSALLESGIRRENIEDCGLCTHCHEHRFYSYRREGRETGRMISVMMLR